MSHGRGRIAAALLVPALASMLVGCDITGNVDVLSDEDVAVDVTVTGMGRGQCSQLTRRLSDMQVERGTTSSGTRFCRIKGIAKTASLPGLDVERVGEYYRLEVELVGMSGPWPTGDLEVAFPGEVLESNHGTVSGSSVRFGDASPLAAGESVRIVALTRPGPPGWVLAGAIGAVAGVLGMIGFRRSRRPSPSDAGSVAAGAGEAPPETPEPVPVIEPVPEPVDPLFYAPPREGGSHATGDGSGDPGQPDAGPLGQTEPDAEASAAAGGSDHPDHSIWAPPAQPEAV